MASGSSRVTIPADDCCCVCFVETKYVCITCELLVCNKCSSFEANEETPGWLMGRSVGYCFACRKPESKLSKDSYSTSTIKTSVLKTIITEEVEHRVTIDILAGEPATVL